MGTEVDTAGVDTTGGQQGTATELEELDIDLPKKTVETDKLEAETPVKQTWQGAVIKDRSLWVKWKFGSGPNSPELRFNPIVAITSVLLVGAFVLWCILATEHASKSFKQAKVWISQTFTWLYIGSQDIWAVVIIAIYFSKYGNMKLGRDDEEPEYPDGTWFAMLFACGVGVGLFFYGVAEPIRHYTQPNRYTHDSHMPDNEVAQNAMLATFFHWGLHSWICYVVVGLLLAFVTFRKGLPMTMKSCFYPLIGDRIYGWMGDVVDIMSIITTIFGVCTSLGLGTMQINAGLHYISPAIAEQTSTQVIIIWVITAIATISVVSGVGIGVRRLSETCFALGMFIMMTVFFLDDSWFLLNLYTQSIGYYMQYLMQIGWHTDAFELLNVTSKMGTDRGRATEILDGQDDGPEDWMNTWTLFYWGWWKSWSPFVGMFIAKISRGRTIRQFINGALTAPMVYTFLWLSIFGGSALRTEKVAVNQPLNGHTNQGLCCSYYKAHINWGVLEDGNSDLNDWDVDSMGVNGSHLLKDSGQYGGEFNNRKVCTQNYLDAWVKDNSDKEWKDFKANYTAMNYPTAISGDQTYARLSCMETTDMWFSLMYTYGKLGNFLSIVSLFGIVLYFVTSSDSGSLVIDIMAANGDQNPPVIQRVFWACLEGATATALLVAGGAEALGALQTASIVTGLPYTIILSFLCVSLWRGLAMEHGDLNPYGNDFFIGIVDPFTTWNPGLLLSFLKYIFITPLAIYNTKMRLDCGKGGATTAAVAATVCWFGWIILLFVDIEVPGLYAVGWVLYLSFIAILTQTRASVRAHHDINGNPIEDFFAALILYPAVAIQCDTALKKHGLATYVPKSVQRRSKVVENNNV